ncbi:MAG TPA: glycogen-binding domain-containing protein [Chitinophagales bacterium]|nr:glycogen-binding domain-containing protein [Chitinophagales bacterium]
MMNHNLSRILFFLMLLFPTVSNAQFAGSTVQVKGDMIIIRIDQKNNDYNNVMLYFGLNEDSLFEYGNIGPLAAQGWELLDLTKRTAKIGRLITSSSSDIYWGNQPFVINFPDVSNTMPGYPGDVVYGANSFIHKPSVFEDHSGNTVFYLPQHLNASTVYLSGNFNDWSTGGTPMTKTDSGWMYSMKLEPGKYFYKFIIDGNWIHDVNNALRESDGHDGFNSAYYVNNTVIRLKGFTDKKDIIFTGSFNNWNEHELHMIKTAGGWELPMFLKEGTYTYKFIADGEWMLDPSNEIARPDGNGNVNSVMSVGDTTFFVLNGFEDAKIVILTGSFNNWNTGELIMQKTSGGWQIPYVLAAGNYTYKYIVDGTWITDPSNPITSGQGDEINSVRTIKPNHVFKLADYPTATNVYLSGSFINWAEPGFKMTKVDGVWKIPVFLQPGKCTYKFIVDGNWITDPANPQTEQNEYGTGNSVIWKEVNAQ